jgi:hypothetical protein
MNGVAGEISKDRLVALREKYRAALFDDVTPWWLRHSLDRECGGYYSLLERDGRPWATDKYIWMTGREIWMFSHLYNRFRQDPQWLEAARWGAAGQCGVHARFLTFAAISAAATPFFWRLVPETKGQSLEEIESHWTA